MVTVSPLIININNKFSFFLFAIIENAINNESVYIDLFIGSDIGGLVSLQNIDRDDHIEKIINILVIFDRFALIDRGLVAD